MSDRDRKLVCCGLPCNLALLGDGGMQHFCWSVNLYRKLFEILSRAGRHEFVARVVEVEAKLGTASGRVWAGYVAYEDLDRYSRSGLGTVGVHGH